VIFVAVRGDDERVARVCVEREQREAHRVSVCDRGARCRRNRVGQRQPRKRSAAGRADAHIVALRRRELCHGNEVATAGGGRGCIDDGAARLDRRMPC
jgi:hypothetical protein